MINIETLDSAAPGLERADIERWIAMAWLRVEGPPGGYSLREIDVARARLIRDLRDGLGVDEETLPIVLSLLDQLYETRRRMAELVAAVAEAVPDDGRREILRVLRDRGRRRPAAADAGTQGPQEH
jgi:chaperone modulatory protein CbpM